MISFSSISRPVIAAALVSLAALSAAPEPPPPPPVPSESAARLPKVWIFNGLPGDDEHHKFYEENLGTLRKALTGRFGLPAENITVLYGPKEAGYDGPCTREALLAELKKIVAHTQAPDAGPAWIIVEGHANPVPGGAMLNLPGPDLSPREFAEGLKGTNPAVPLVLFFTTTSSAEFLKAVAGPGRIVDTATTNGDPESETEAPLALAQALASPATDANGDRIVSVTELFQAMAAGVLKIYEAEKFMVKEHAQLDGNGDGRASQRPSPEDAEPAKAVGLRVSAGKAFD